MEMKEGQFGKIGEHMVGFELSKRGWIVFFPPYDEMSKEINAQCLIVTAQDIK
ncbi:MAG: hypothetical protein HY097_08795 [Nitrospinae bacterium]|nr:hypothetical protein [Nitrospinota bacterium]MBI3813562.1 hypothetical protein [Nitrospinota bacterium]